MSKCQADLFSMIRARLAAAETTLHVMTMAGRFALVATTERDERIAQCEEVRKTMADVISLCQTTLDTTTVKPVLNGLDAFMWTYQQLSSTDWSGPPKTSNSYIKWGYVGKPETSVGSGSTSSGNATLVEMSTHVSTSTTQEALKALNKSIMEAVELRARYDDQRP